MKQITQIEYSNRRREILEMARAADWTFLEEQINIGMISFRKSEMRINIYITTLTVATCLNHPKKGKTQLFRKCISLKQMKTIFANPRVHTQKGYYKRK